MNRDSTLSGIAGLPVQGFHWRMRDDWLSADLNGFVVEPIFRSLWNEYLLPTHSNVIRFHIDIMAYREGPMGTEQRHANAVVINRLINLARFARDTGVRIIPIFAGSNHYGSGKERSFPLRVAALVENLLAKLTGTGNVDLYEQIAMWQVEDEMNHPIRHRGWKDRVYTEMLLTACKKIRAVEQTYDVSYHPLRMVIFPADLMFFRDFVVRPWCYVPAILSRGLYDFDPPRDFQAFVSSPHVDVIGVDLYPGLYAPLATTETFLMLVKYLCELYGRRTRYAKQILVAEAGYPTWPSSYQREENQLRFYKELMTGLSEYYWSGVGRECGFLGLIWYCFNDQRIRPIIWPPQEWRFGVIKTVPRNEWFATYPADPKLAWFWLRDNVMPYCEHDKTCQRS